MTLPHGGDIYHYSRKYRMPADDILDFSASINPVGPSPAALRAIKGSLKMIDNYPDPDCSAMTGALSEYLGVPMRSILPANGSTELIYLLPRALKPGRVIVVSPGFSDYERAAKLAGAGVKRISLVENRGFVPDLERIAGYLDSTDMLFLCNPNNPTGVLVEKTGVLGLLKAASSAGAFVVVDEAFTEYCPGGSVAREASGMGGVAVLRNFTKFFGMPGLRAGYMVGAPRLVERLRKAQEPWSVNVLAQSAATASVSDEAYIIKSLSLMAAERAFLFDGLSRIRGLKPHPSSANFFLVRLDTGQGAAALAEELASRGILVRDCSNFRGLDGRFIRVAVRTRAENERLVEAVKRSRCFTGG